MGRELDAIRELLEQLTGEFADFRQWRGSLDQQIKNLLDMVRGVRNTVYGNPQAENGLVSKVQRLWDKVWGNGAPRAAAAAGVNWREFWLAVFRQVLACILTAAVLGFIAYFFFLYRKLPLA